MSIDISKICRICLEVIDTAYDIFTSYCFKRKTLYSDMLSNCTKLKPYEQDGLPRLICKNCCKQLKRTYTFNLRCEESDRTLRNYLDEYKCYDASIVTDCTTGVEVKNEHLEVKNEVELNGCDEGGGTENNIHSDELDSKECLEGDNIKNEPSYLNDDGGGGDGGIGWDAEDDNVLLEEIKSKKYNAQADLSFGEVTKKKRGCKRKTGDAAGGAAQAHQCDVCGKLLSTKSNLKAHALCHTDLRPYRCALCPATFRGHSALFQHKKVHTGETPYHCEHCPKRFSRRTGLVNHIRMHQAEKLYSCSVCGKKFVQSAQLAVHMRRDQGDRPFLCQDCGKGFPVKADLKVHQRTHNGEKPYACHLCTKTFATSGNFSIHVRIHNKEIRYRCGECLRGFVTCSAFRVHVKRHRGQRDYSCHCGKTFYTSSALNQHTVVHTGEKKYQCKICERKFKQTSHLSRHCKRDHAPPGPPRRPRRRTPSRPLRRPTPYRSPYIAGGPADILYNTEA